MDERKFNPCVDYCYIRHGRQYDPSICDGTCEFAAAHVKIRELERQIEILKENSADGE